MRNLNKYCFFSINQSIKNILLLKQQGQVNGFYTVLQNNKSSREPDEASLYTLVPEQFKFAECRINMSTIIWN